MFKAGNNQVSFSSNGKLPSLASRREAIFKAIRNSRAALEALLEDTAEMSKLSTVPDAEFALKTAEATYGVLRTSCIATLDELAKKDPTNHALLVQVTTNIHGPLIVTALSLRGLEQASTNALDTQLRQIANDMLTEVKKPLQ